MALKLRNQSLYSKEYVGEITQAFDKHLLIDDKDLISWVHHTYLCEREICNWDGKEHIVYSFRVPGATRGHIEVDAENTIIDIVLIEDTCFGVVACYKQTLREEIKLWIGTKLEFEEEQK